MRSVVHSVLVGLLSLASAKALADAAWSLERSSDPRTGATLATAFTIYREGPLAKGAVVRCRERTLEVYVELGEPLGRARAPVKYRADKSGWRSEEGAVSSDGSAVFARNQAEIARLWMRGARFVIETTSARGEPRRAAFVLTGSSQVIRRVLEQCQGAAPKG